MPITASRILLCSNGEIIHENGEILYSGSCDCTSCGEEQT